MVLAPIGMQPIKHTDTDGNTPTEPPYAPYGSLGAAQRNPGFAALHPGYHALKRANKTCNLSFYA